MMYQNKFVAAVKADGKILRESSNLVTLPFGSEYSILLKNLNSVRAMAEITIDGKSATDGTKLIIAPNSSVEIERSIRKGNFDKGNRFKFIERTDAIEEHRGILADDGIIRVEFWTEKVYPIPAWQSYTTTWQYPVTNTGFLGNQWQNTNFIGGQHLNSTTRGSGMLCQSFSEDSAFEKSDAGITVPGSESDQKFTNGAWFSTEYQSDVIVLQLRGEVAGKPVQKPITVAMRPYCTTCGRANPANAKFCGQCATALNII